MTPTEWDDIYDVYARRCHGFRKCLARLRKGIEDGEDPKLLMRRIDTMFEVDGWDREELEKLSAKTLKALEMV